MVVSAGYLVRIYGNMARSQDWAIDSALKFVPPVGREPHQAEVLICSFACWQEFRCMVAFGPVMTMKTNSQLQKLRKLEQQSQRIRKELNVSKPGEVIFHAPEGLWSDNDIVVEADGLGGAKVLLVEGNYPIDYSIKSERKFRDEDAACEAAEKMEQR